MHSFHRYGDAIISAVLSDLPPSNESVDLHTVEARLLHREWRAHWNMHEIWSRVHVRSGWVNEVGLERERGRASRIFRLSIDGVSDVTNNATWLDDAVARLIDTSNLPNAFMPGDGDAEDQEDEVRPLLVTESSDFNVNEQGRNGNDTEGMEVAEQQELPQVDLEPVPHQLLPLGPGPSM